MFIYILTLLVLKGIYHYWTYLFFYFSGGLKQLEAAKKGYSCWCAVRNDQGLGMKECPERKPHGMVYGVHSLMPWRTTKGHDLSLLPKKSLVGGQLQENQPIPPQDIGTFRERMKPARNQTCGPISFFRLASQKRRPHSPPMGPSCHLRLAYIQIIRI